MSHFSVLVFSESPGEVRSLLEPYSETDESLFDYVPVSEETRAELEQGFAEDPGQSVSFEDYVTDQDYHFHDGEVCYFCNPDAKWDWYSEGGRWADEPPIKKEYADDPDSMGESIPAYMIDISQNKEEREKYVRFWEVLVEGQPLRDGEEKPSSWFKKEYYVDLYKTKDFFADMCARFYPHAFVDCDGGWHEAGEVGWFGCSDESHESLEKYVKEFDEAIDFAVKHNLVATMIDCHI